MEKRLVGGEHWKSIFSMEDWSKGGDTIVLMQLRQSGIHNTEVKGAMDDTSEFTDWNDEETQSEEESEETQSEEEEPVPFNVDSHIEKDNASHRLRDEGAHEVEREGAVPGTVGSHTHTPHTTYASVYFQRDGIPLWCIKHRICFTALD
jgi:hypothetical protein